MAELKTKRSEILSEDESYRINIRYETSPMVPPPPLDLPLNRLLLSLRWLVHASYLKARYTQALNLGDWLPWSTLILEICGGVPIFATQLGLSLGFFAKIPPRRGYELVGDHVPRVSVFITCCGEDPEIVMDTLQSASNQDYPRD